MAIRKILEFPDPRLRTRAASVEVVDERIQTLIDDMFETMYDANGIGLAASQIDVHEQVIVIDLSSCLLYTSPSPRDMRRSRMPSSA